MTLNASILTTPQWRERRKSIIRRLMARKLISDRNRMVAQRLLWARIAAGYGHKKQGAYAREAELQPTTYNMWEKGKTFPPADEAVKLFDKFGITLDWIYRGDTRLLPSYIAQGIQSQIDADHAKTAAADAKKAEPVQAQEVADPPAKVVQPSKQRHHAA